ncbi:hypothetical protein EW145_g3579 [Phellinidium pouzarii]|uniref:Uncharacterized protein n=1 Tax=Phellinidium pouzarii TaxID=167371 RepID=A0A4S4L855_9AGAM|nr:hypothetical protein EW145_g3579 [Phellinidium pouzarii]
MARTPFCNKALTTGACAQEGCTSRHDIRHCQPCGLYLIPSNWDAHIVGKKHQRLAQRVSESQETPVRGDCYSKSPSARESCAHLSRSSGNPSVRCDACGIFLLNYTAYDAHKNSRRHKAAFAKLLVTPAFVQELPSANPPSNGYIHCPCCNWNVEAHNMEKHEKEDRHIRRKLAAELDGALGLAQKNKLGIKVTNEDGVDFGIVDITHHSRYGLAPRTVGIEKVDREYQIALKSFIVLPQVGSPGSETSFTVSLKGTSRWINIRRPLSLEVSLKSSCIGRHVALLELIFHCVDTKSEFTIVRELRALVGSSEDHETLLPSAPYSRPPSVRPVTTDSIHAGRHPVIWTKVKYTTRLPQYLAPPELIAAVFDQNRTVSIANIKKKVHARRPYDSNVLSCDLAQRALTDRELQPKNHYYILEIPEVKKPGFRPKLVVGDTMLFQHTDSSDKMWYQGVIHEIVGEYKSTFKLRFDSSSGFSTYRGKRFDVQFVLNRIPFKRAHQAVTSSFSSRRLLFPDVNDKKLSSVSGEELAFFKRCIGENPAQKDVVEAVLSMVPGCSPLIIYGTPGTGKTSTVVETIQQLAHRDSRSRILACAPSNMAADLIALLLKHSGTSSLLRLCAFSREAHEMPAELRDIAIINANEVFAFPPVEQLKKFQIIVCTCATSGVLKNLGLFQGHFGFIFVDEAGQASEPTAMIPIKTMADNYTNVILFGDKDQLGPVVRSITASRLGLGKSYMERLMENGIKPTSGVIIKKLKEHYRSHDAIIAFPNKEFYNNELIPRGNPAVTHSLLKRDILVNPDFPIVFHGVSGKDEREDKDPSFFNASEAILVKSYVSQLMGDKKLRLEQQHIGVISPYNAQCRKIAKLFKDWPNIKIGNVEDYQGQERRIIIISTVRSSLKLVSYDLKNNLGFVADRRRFNAAVTRAQALLIIIGDPQVLSIDPLWRRFLNYIYHQRGGWSPKGKRIDWDANEDVTAQKFDDERREKARASVQTFIERTTSKLVDNPDVLENDGGQISESFMDRPWSNEDE